MEKVNDLREKPIQALTKQEISGRIALAQDHLTNLEAEAEETRAMLAALRIELKQRMTKTFGD